MLRSAWNRIKSLVAGIDWQLVRQMAYGIVFLGLLLTGARSIHTLHQLFNALSMLAHGAPFKAALAMPVTDLALLGIWFAAGSVLLSRFGNFIRTIPGLILTVVTGFCIDFLLILISCMLFAGKSDVVGNAALVSGMSVTAITSAVVAVFLAAALVAFVVWWIMQRRGRVDDLTASMTLVSGR